MLTSGDTLYHGSYKEGVLHRMPRKESSIGDIQGNHARSLMRGINSASKDFLDYTIGFSLTENPEHAVRLFGHTKRNAQGGQAVGLTICLMALEDIEEVLKHPADIQEINKELNRWMTANKGYPVFIHNQSIVHNDPLSTPHKDSIDLLLSLLGFSHYLDGIFKRTQIVELLQSVYSVTPAIYRRLKSFGRAVRPDQDVSISDVIGWLLDDYQNSPEPTKVTEMTPERIRDLLRMNTRR